MLGSYANQTNAANESQVVNTDELLDLNKYLVANHINVNSNAAYDAQMYYQSLVTNDYRDHQSSNQFFQGQTSLLPYQNSNQSTIIPTPLLTSFQQPEYTADPLKPAKKIRNYEERYRSKFKGVFKCGKRYKAQIQTHRVQHYLGTYDTELEAAIAYDNHARMALGKKAKTNFDYDEPSITQLPTTAVAVPILPLPTSLPTAIKPTPESKSYDSLINYNLSCIPTTALEELQEQTEDTNPDDVTSSKASNKRFYVGLKAKRKAVLDRLNNLTDPMNILPQMQQQNYTNNHTHNNTTIANGTNMNNIYTDNNHLNTTYTSRAPPVVSAAVNHDLELQVYNQYHLYQQYLQYQQQQQQNNLMQMPTNALGGGYVPITINPYMQNPSITNLLIEQGHQDYNLSSSSTNDVHKNNQEVKSIFTSLDSNEIQNTVHQAGEAGEEETEELDWREQLYYWTGQLCYVPLTKQLSWKGVWVGSYTGKPSITEFNTSRNSFEYVSEYAIDASQVSADDGSLKPLSSYYLGYYLMDNNGSGLLEKYIDHEYFMDFELVSNTFHGNQYSVVGKGDSEFGTFLVTGMFYTHTGVMEMIRQYIPDTDERCIMNILQLKQTLHNDVSH